MKGNSPCAGAGAADDGCRGRPAAVSGLEADGGEDDRGDGEQSSDEAGLLGGFNALPFVGGCPSGRDTETSAGMLLPSWWGVRGRRRAPDKSGISGQTRPRGRAASRPARRNARLQWPVELRRLQGVRTWRTADPVEHGFPHLDTVRASITALCKRLSHDTVQRLLGQRGARRRGLRRRRRPAPRGPAGGPRDGPRTTGCRTPGWSSASARWTHAANVELAAGPEYFIELNDRFRTHRRDIGAALAHEVMHVYLHRLDLSFPGTRDNEILTDTAATYLGAGWLLLDAYREHGAVLAEARLPDPGGVRLRPRQAGPVLRRGPVAVVHQPAGVRGVHRGRGAGPPRTTGSRRSRGRRGRAAGCATPRTAGRRRSTARAARPAGPPGPPTPSRAPRGRCGCRSPAPPATSASGSRSAAGCRPAAALCRTVLDCDT